MRESYTTGLMQGRFFHEACFDGQFIPKGYMRIAQRFNVGFRRPAGRSPEGTAENPQRLSRPFGTSGYFFAAYPTLKRWAIFGSPFGRTARLAAALLTCALLAWPAAIHATTPKKVLVVTVTKGFRHSSISTAEKVLAELGEKSGIFTVDY